MTKRRITIDGKNYTVLTRDNGDIEISVTWDAVVPSTAHLTHPSYCQRRAAVRTAGTTGKKVLAALRAA